MKNLSTYCLFTYCQVLLTIILVEGTCDIKVHDDVIRQYGNNCGFVDISKVPTPNCNFIHLRDDSIYGTLQIVEPSIYHNKIIGDAYQEFEVDLQCDVSFFGDKVMQVVREQLVDTKFSTIINCDLIHDNKCVELRELYYCSWMDTKLRTIRVVRRQKVRLSFNYRGELIYPFIIDGCSINNEICKRDNLFLVKPPLTTTNNESPCDYQVVYSIKGYLYQNDDGNVYNFHHAINPIMFSFPKNSSSKDLCIDGAIYFNSKPLIAKFIANTNTININKHSQSEKEYVSMGQLSFLYELHKTDALLESQQICSIHTHMYHMALSVAKLGDIKPVMLLWSEHKNIISSLHDDNKIKVCSLPDDFECIKEEIAVSSEGDIIVNPSLKLCYEKNTNMIVSCPYAKQGNTIINTTILLNNQAYLKVTNNKVDKKLLHMTSIKLLHRPFYSVDWGMEQYTDYPTLTHVRFFPFLEHHNGVIKSTVTAVTSYITSFYNLFVILFTILFILLITSQIKFLHDVFKKKDKKEYSKIDTIPVLARQRRELKNSNWIQLT